MSAVSSAARSRPDPESCQTGRAATPQPTVFVPSPRLVCRPSPHVVGPWGYALELRCCWVCGDVVASVGRRGRIIRHLSRCVVVALLQSVGGRRAAMPHAPQRCPSGAEKQSPAARVRISRPISVAGSPRNPKNMHRDDANDEIALQRDESVVNRVATRRVLTMHLTPDPDLIPSGSADLSRCNAMK